MTHERTKSERSTWGCSLVIYFYSIFFIHQDILGSDTHYINKLCTNTSDMSQYLLFSIVMLFNWWWLLKDEWNVLLQAVLSIRNPVHSIIWLTRFSSTSFMLFVKHRSKKIMCLFICSNEEKNWRQVFEIKNDLYWFMFISL